MPREKQKNASYVVRGDVHVAQMHELFRRMVFNILIDNTDDHEKTSAIRNPSLHHGLLRQAQHVGFSFIHAEKVMYPNRNGLDTFCLEPRRVLTLGEMAKGDPPDLGDGACKLREGCPDPRPAHKFTDAFAARDAQAAIHSRPYVSLLPWLSANKAVRGKRAAVKMASLTHRPADWLSSARTHAMNVLKATSRGT